MNHNEINKDAVIYTIEQNLNQKLQYLPSSINNMFVDNIGQTKVIDSGMPTDIFNTAYGGIVTQKVANDVMQYYMQRKVPMAWWIGPYSSKNNGLEIYMKNAGFILDRKVNGMYLNLVINELKPYKVPKLLTIKLCETVEDFEDFGKMMASTIMVDPVQEHIKSFYNKVAKIPIQNRKKMKFFVGYINDKPVATAGVFFFDVAGIYNVSTVNDMQRKGYGTAMVYTALKFALESGCKDIVLQASKDGLGIYKRFGFEEVCEFNVWSNRGFL